MKKEPTNRYIWVIEICNVSLILNLESSIADPNQTGLKFIVFYLSQQLCGMEFFNFKFSRIPTYWIVETMFAYENFIISAVSQKCNLGNQCCWSF